MLRIAKVVNYPYEWQANLALSRNVDLTDSEIEAAASDEAVSGIAPDYVLVCKVTDELSATATLTDATLDTLTTRFGAVASRKLILITGWSNLLSRFLNACRVPLEVSDKLSGKIPPLI